jgi:hypothetical protein
MQSTGSHEPSQQVIILCTDRTQPMNRAQELELKQIRSNIASFHLYKNSAIRRKTWRNEKFADWVAQQKIQKKKEHPPPQKKAMLDLIMKITKISSCLILKPSLYQKLVIEI